MADLFRPSTLSPDYSSRLLKSAPTDFVGLSMSLFENSKFRWRETYFVLFDRLNRPSCADIRAALSDLGDRYEIGESLENDDAQFESFALFSPMDCAAMDILLVEGEDGRE